MTRSLSGKARNTANALHLQPDHLAPRLTDAPPNVREALDRAADDPDFLVSLRERIDAQPDPEATQTPQEAPRRVDDTHPDPEATDVVRFARGTLGIDLSPRQAECLAAYFARPGGELLARIGRQGGKSLIGAIAIAFVADQQAELYRAKLPVGTISCLIIANSAEQAAVPFSRLRTWYETIPELAAKVVSITADTITLMGDWKISALPASGRTGRGRSAAVVFLDEIGYGWDSDGPASAPALYRALWPSTVRFEELGRTILASTPATRQGLFWEHCEAAEKGDMSILYRTAPTWEMYPGSVTPEAMAALAGGNVDLQRELAGEWLDADQKAFLDPETVDANIRPGPLWLPADPWRETVACIDPAWASRGDAFAFAAGWRDGERLIVAGVTAWRGGRAADLDAAGTFDAVAALCHEYAVRRCLTDQAAGPVVVQELERRKVPIERVAWTNELKWKVLTTFRAKLNAGLVELPPDAETRRELIGLTTSTTASGRPQVAAAGTGHDDRALSVAMLIYQLAGLEGVLLFV